MSAVISTREIMNEWKPGMHGTTFGGNPVAAAAANAVLDQFEDGSLLENVNIYYGRVSSERAEKAPGGLSHYL